MSAERKWAPGDVALVMRDGVEVCASFYDTGHERGWYHGSGLTSSHYFFADRGTEPRPLVVIDPAALTVPRDGGDSNYNAAELARTLRLLADADQKGTQTYRSRIVRELADVIDPPPPPPKPEEPSGLGAAIEDSDGVVWVRMEDGYWSSHHEHRVDYSQIAAVKVLSEGVTP